MFILSHISASSLTRPALTARKVFSRSFTISATRVELTGTIVSMAVPQRARELGTVRRQSSNDLRHVVRLERRIAGVDALGENAMKKSTPALSPVASSIG